jgi:MAF protein
MSSNKEKNGIVLNRMYVGDYLATNLGHEVINLFKADNGKHYIYLNATGNFSNVHSDKIGYMLFVKYHVDGAIEVIGMAKGLSDIPGANKTLHRDIVYKGIDDNIWQLQKNYIDAQTNKQGEGISYGGVPILDIFKDSNQQSILITYEAKNVYKPCKRIFIRYSNVDINCNDEHICVTLEGYNQATTSLKCYIYPEGTYKREQDKGDIDKKIDDYTKIFTQIIKNDSIWKEVKTLKETIDESKQEYKKSLTREVSIFDICRIQNNENAFSDALKHFLEQTKYIELWQKFFREVKFCMLDDQYNCKPLNIKLEDYCVAREEDISKNSPLSGRIDLVIRDKENIIVIGADTVVALGDTIYGKPKDKADAINMLKTLSGKEHSVITGVAIIKNENGEVEILKPSEETFVKFKALTDEEIEDYTNTNEPYDKAGSYALQGEAKKFVEYVKGDSENVIGLPAGKIKKYLI